MVFGKESPSPQKGDVVNVVLLGRVSRVDDWVPIETLHCVGVVGVGKVSHHY